MALPVNSFAIFDDEEAEDLLVVLMNVTKKQAEEAEKAHKLAEEEEEARRQAELARRQAEAETWAQQQAFSGEISLQLPPQQYVQGRGGSGSGHNQNRSGRNGGHRNENGYTSNGGYKGRGGRSSGFGGRDQGQTKSFDEANGLKNETRVVEAEKMDQNKDQEEKVWQSVTKDHPYRDTKQNNRWVNKGQGNNRYRGDGGYNRGGRNNGSVEWRPAFGFNRALSENSPVIGDANNDNAAEITELAKDTANDASGKNAEVVEESEDQKKVRLKEEKEKEIARKGREKFEKEREERRKEREEEKKRMTLKQYEAAVLSEKRKALEDKAKKLEERKVTLDMSFETMSLIERRDEDSLLVKLEPETEKSHKLKKKSAKVQKISISEFLKATEAKRSEGKSVEGDDLKQPSVGEIKYNNGCGDGGRGRGRGRGLGRGRGAGALSRQDTSFGNGEPSRIDGGFRKPTENSNGNNRGGRVEYQRATSNPPVARDVQCNGSETVKTLPPVEDAEQFPDLRKL